MSKTTRAHKKWDPGAIALRMCLAPMLALLLAPQAVQAAPDKPTIVSVQTLDFGTFVVLPSCVGCSITMNPDGSRTATPGIVLSTKNNGRPAKFSIGCNNPACTYTVSVTPSSVSMAAGSITMSVGSFTSSKSSATTPRTLSVGAKLTIPAPGSAASTYTSTSFSVSAS